MSTSAGPASDGTLRRPRRTEAERRVAPQLLDREEFAAVMITAIATIRGLRVLRAAASEPAVRRAWSAARDQLLAGLPQE